MVGAAGGQQVPFRLRRFGMTRLNLEVVTSGSEWQSLIIYLPEAAASDSAMLAARNVSQSVRTRSHSWIMIP